MNLETIPIRVLLRWVGFVVALGTVIAILTPHMSGLTWVAFGLAFLIVFRPYATPHITDAELQEWLARG